MDLFRTVDPGYADSDAAVAHPLIRYLPFRHLLIWHLLIWILLI
jgi:hypothetical protein